jgi:hypothetical protein
MNFRIAPFAIRRVPVWVTLRPTQTMDQGSIVGLLLPHKLTALEFEQLSCRRHATPLGIDEAVRRRQGIAVDNQ